jgi:hypothetical protein
MTKGESLIKQFFLLTGNLSNILGEATMRGFLKLRTICLLSKWKYCAGVVGCTTDMFTVSPSTPSSALSHSWERKEGSIRLIFCNHKDHILAKGKPMCSRLIRDRSLCYKGITEDKFMTCKVLTRGEF